MFNKAQVTVGVLISVFMMVIVGVSLLLPIASQVESTRNLAFFNSSVATGAIDVAVEMPGAGITGTVIAVNATGQLLSEGPDFVVGSRQPPITSGVVTNTFTPLLLRSTNQNIQISYEGEPDGFITSSGGRSIIALVILFAALAIGVIAIIPVARSGIMDMFGR